MTATHLVNTGEIDLFGNTTSGTTSQATLNVTGDAAPDTVAAGVSINLNGDALLEFAGGGITSIAEGGELAIDGVQSRIADKGRLSANSALTGLSNNAGNLSLGDGALPGNSAVAFTNSGTYNIFNHVAVKTSLDFSNSGFIYIDSGDMQGGSTLTVLGTLTNMGTLEVGSGFYQNLASSSTVTATHLANTGEIDLLGNTNSGTTFQATLNITGDAAPNTLASGISLNLAGDALLEFASGGIATIAAGAQLTLDGAQSRVADKGHAVTSTALTGLSDNAGTLSLSDRATIGNSAVAFTNSGTYSVSNHVLVTANAGFTNSGTIYIDADDMQGGSALKVSGTLTNNGVLQVGNSLFQNLDAASTVTTTHLANSGEIDLFGNATAGTTFQATLNDTGDAAPGTLVSGVSINLNGDALLEFASGGITSIAANAQLTLDGAQSRVADAGHLTTNSALTGLSSNAGTLSLSDKASIANSAVAFTNSGVYSLSNNVSVETNLDFANNGTIYIDAGNGQGGSSLTVSGTLTNSGVLQLGSSFYENLDASTRVTTAHLANTGEIDLLGNATPGTSFQATLNVTGDAAPNILVSGVSINLDGDALLEFASGGITSIADNAQLTLDGAQSRIADSAHSLSNSALTGLSSNAGTLSLSDGALLGNNAVAFNNSGTYSLSNNVAIKTNLDFANNGIMYIDDGNGQGGSSLTVSGTLTNNGMLQLGSGFYQNLGASTTVTTAHLANTGEIDLLGNVTSGTTFRATLDVTGDAAPDTLVSGVSINLAGDALLEFASGGITSIAANAQLTLDSAQSFVADKGHLTTNSALSGLNDNAGYLEVANGAALTTSHGVNFTNSGGIDVDDDADQGGTINLGGKLTNTVSGTITLDGSEGSVATLVVNGNASNSGTMTIGDPDIDDTFAAVTLTGVASSYMQSAGQTEILGMLTAPNVVVSGGLLEASGTIVGNVNVTGGDIAGGLISQSGFGTLTLQGNFTQASAGTMETLMSADGSGQSSIIAVSGSAIHLNGGTLSLTVVDPQNLTVGETFTVMTFAPGTLHGQFGAMTDGSFTGSGTSIVIDGGATLDASYNNSAGNIQLTVVTAPGGAPVMRDIAGQNVFDFASAAVGAAHQAIDNFDAASDRLHFSFGVAGIDVAVKAPDFSDLAAAAAHLGAHHAELFTPMGGAPAGEVFLIVDANGAPGFQAGEDFAVRLEGSTHMADFGTGSFV